SRLSDIALEWMIDEATSIPDPLIVDRSRLKTTPDASGMQHSEVERVQDQDLWWVPRWAPSFLREGWPLGRRNPIGSPVHLPVFERFATPAVIQSTGVAEYRPVNLAEDLRFSPYYSQAPSSDPMDLVAATYEAGDHTFNGVLGTLSNTLAGLLKDE